MKNFSPHCLEGRSPTEHFEPITDRDENKLWYRMQKTGVEVRLSDIRNLIHSEYIPKLPNEDEQQLTEQGRHAHHVGGLLASKDAQRLQSATRQLEQLLPELN